MKHISFLHIVRRAAVFCAAAALLIGVLGCGDKSAENKSDAYRQKAVQAYHSGEYAKAAEYFEKMIGEDKEIALKIYQALNLILTHRLRDTTERLAIANRIIRASSR